MKKTKTSGFFGALFFIFAALLFAGCASAIIVPEIYFTSGPNLQKNSFNAGEKIAGNVDLENMAGAAIDDLSLECLLLNNQSGGKIQPMELLAQTIDKQKFGLVAGQKANREFSCAIPENIPAGEMIFRVRLVNGKGEGMLWADKKIEISEGGNFLYLHNRWVEKDGKLYDPGQGVYYAVGDTANAVFDIVNDSDTSIDAFYKITNYTRNLGTPALKEEKKEAVSFAPGEKKTVKTALPKEEAPETYFSEIQFFDKKTQKPVSNPITFRWIISGENAKILFMLLDKESYTAGDTAQVKVNYVGSADPNAVDMGKGNIEAAVFDQSGQEAGRAVKEIDFKNSEAIILVPIQKEAIRAKLSARIVKGGKIFDSYEYAVGAGEEGSSVQDQKPAETPAVSIQEQPDFKPFWIAGLVIVAALIILIIVKKQNKKGTKIAALILVFAGLSLFSGAKAAVEVVDGPSSHIRAWNSPVKNQKFLPGDKIKFEGSIKLGGCANSVFMNKLVFYVAEDKDIPYTDCMGRDYPSSDSREFSTCSEAIGCFGMNSRMQGVDDCTSYLIDRGKGITECNFCGGNHVKYLDTAKGHKIYKLGELKEGSGELVTNKAWNSVLQYCQANCNDLAMYVVNGEVFYNKEFVIPANIDLSGPVRFYAAWVGHHSHQEWHWNISYQPGFISDLKNLRAALNAVPDTGIGAVTSTLTVTARGVTGNSNYYIWWDCNSNCATKADCETACGKVADAVNTNSSGEYSIIHLYNSAKVFHPRAVIENGTQSDGAGATVTVKSVPTVDVSVSPASPTTGDNVTILAQAVDATSGLKNIKIYLNGAYQKTCTYTGQTTPQNCSKFSGLLPAGAYTYYATALNKDGVTETSVTKNFTVIALPLPTLTASLTANPDTGIGSVNAVFTADPGGTATGLTHYTIWWNCPSGATCANETDCNAICGNYADPAKGRQVLFSSDDPYTGFTHIYDVVGTYYPRVLIGRQNVVAASSATINVTNPPFSAKMECAATNCDTTAFCISNPNGPGCACDNTPGAPWVMYRSTPETDNPCNFKINNKSTGNIDWSTWNFAGASHNYNYPKQAGKADYGTVPSSVLNDNYNVTLKVEKGAVSATASRSLSVRNDIQAGFACSLDQVKWQDCAVIANKVAKGEKIYFKDSASTLKSYSIASGGSNIEQRVWTFNGVKIIKLDGVPVLPDQQEVFASLAEGNNTITLEVKDGNGRTDAKTYPLESFSLPKWQEVSPVSMMDNLMAAAYRVFAAIFWPVQP